MLFLGESSELFLPTTAHLVFALVGVAVWAFLTRREGLRRWRYGLAVAAVWAWVMSAPIVADVLLRSLEGNPDLAKDIAVARDPGSAVIVLSSGELRTPRGVTRVRLNMMGWERLHGGVELWRRTGGKIIFTAGPKGDVASSMAALMSALAQDLGVPPEAIVTDPQAITTYQELLAARALLKDQHGPVWVVTSAIHMPRALQTARQMGLQVRPYPVGYRQIGHYTWWSWLPHNGTQERMSAALHEYIGMAWYRLKGSPQ